MTFAEGLRVKEEGSLIATEAGSRRELKMISGWFYMFVRAIVNAIQRVRSTSGLKVFCSTI